MLDFCMVEEGGSEAHGALLRRLAELKAAEGKDRKRKKKASFRQEKRLNYYSGWSPKQ